MKNKLNKNNEDIDFIKLIEIVLKNKFKILFMSLIGVIIGIFYTFYQTPKFNTSFMIVVEHPALIESELFESPYLQNLLNDSYVDDEKMPNFSLNKKNKIFNIISEQENIRPIVKKEFLVIISEIIEAKKKLAVDIKILDKQFILNPDVIKDFYFLTKGEIHNIKTEDVVKSLKISFGQTKQISPAPLKYGFFGLVLSLIILFIFMVCQFVLRTIKMKSK